MAFTSVRFKEGQNFLPLDVFKAPSSEGRLKLLSYNIQVGIETDAFHQYLTKSWQHLWPNSRRNSALMRIAQVMSYFDVVAVQEADGGSWRSGFINQVEYLAKHGGFKYWFQQLNRNLGKVAQHSNGALCRNLPDQVDYHKLPGMLPGRGAMLLQYGQGEHALAIVVMHLALGRRGQNRQLAFVKELIQDYRHVILMGDLNTQSDHLLNRSPLASLNLQPVERGLNTFPSWRPRAALDHILVSEAVKVHQVGVLDISVSDHLPIAMEVEIPHPTQQR